MMRNPQIEEKEHKKQRQKIANRAWISNLYSLERKEALECRCYQSPNRSQVPNLIP